MLQRIKTNYRRCFKTTQVPGTKNSSDRGKIKQDKQRRALPSFRFFSLIVFAAFSAYCFSLSAFLLYPLYEPIKWSSGYPARIAPMIIPSKQHLSSCIISLPKIDKHVMYQNEVNKRSLLSLKSVMCMLSSISQRVKQA